MTSSREHVIDRVRHAAARVAGTHGLEIFDVQLRRESIGWVLRIVIDRVTTPEPAAVGPGTPEEAVGIEDCQRVSRDLSALLDVEDELVEGIDREYTLEVSSPGLDRPLRGEADFRRFVGRLAKVVTREPLGGQSHFAGRLSGIDSGDVLIAEGKRVHRVPLSLVSRARLEVEF